MGQKIAVILMLVITVVLIVYLLVLVLTGGNKEKLNFKHKREQKRQQEIERGIVTREDKVKEKEELKKALAEKKAEQKAADAEYDNAVKANIQKFKEEKKDNLIDRIKRILLNCYESVKAKVKYIFSNIWKNIKGSKRFSRCN